MPLYLGTQITLTGIVLTLAIVFGIGVHSAIVGKKRPSTLVMFVTLALLFASLLAIPVGALIRIWS